MNEQDEEEMAAASKVDSDKDIKDGPMRPEEKRRLNWEGKTYLVSADSSSFCDAKRGRADLFVASLLSSPLPFFRLLSPPLVRLVSLSPPILTSTNLPSLLTSQETSPSVVSASPSAPTSPARKWVSLPPSSKERVPNGLSPNDTSPRRTLEFKSVDPRRLNSFLLLRRSRISVLMWISWMSTLGE